LLVGTRWLARMIAGGWKLQVGIRFCSGSRRKAYSSLRWYSA